MLDRLVGYKLSPFSVAEDPPGACRRAGVQSVAVRLIDDREKEIEAFVPEEYWNVDLTLSSHGKRFTARLAADEKGKKLLPRTEAGGPRHREGAGRGRLHGGGNSKRASAASSPPPRSSPVPSSRRRPGVWASPPPAPMRAAQTLYEGVDIAGYGHGGPHHLYAYRQPADLGRGGGRRPGLYRRGLRPAVYLPVQAHLEDQKRHRRPGCPRGHPALDAGLDPRRGG